MATQTNINTISPPRTDLEVQDFEHIIAQKGQEVVFEKALQCPCKSKDTNQQSSCQNCGGSGWFFINPKKTRMILTSLSITTDYKAWSEESRGTIRITSSSTEELTYMDRITVLLGQAIYQEVVFFKKSTGGQYFCWSAYPIKKVLYAGMFISTATPIGRLNAANIILQNKNLIVLDSNVIPYPNPDEIAVTLRYYHAPIYHVLEMPRETLQSYKYESGAEVVQNLPVSALGRRMHYVQNAPKLTGERLLDNSYPELCCSLEVCEITTTTTTTDVLDTEDHKDIDTEGGDEILIN